ncbi:hypothetical protein PMAYCL1PPCAC_10684, partial [Pristionchus mayeri]
FLGAKIPEHPKAAGILPFYNNSYEPEFLVQTGLGSTENVTKTISYGGERKTHWNIGEDLQKCSEGGLNKPLLQPEDKLYVFVSYISRAFELEVHKASSFEAVPTYEYRVDQEEFNTNGNKHVGMRYENEEGLDYFPAWNPCPVDRPFNPSNTSCASIDCSQGEHLCNECCTGKHFNGTVFTPPGFYQMKTLPGRMYDAPIPIFASPPHMLWAPNQVSSSLVGQSPNEEMHQPIEWIVNPTLGAAVHAHARVQFSLPIWKGALTQSSSLPNSIAPLGWLHLEVQMHEDMMTLVKLGGLYVP